jgi:hypothetical protein
MNRYGFFVVLLLRMTFDTKPRGGEKGKNELH